MINTNSLWKKIFSRYEDADLFTRTTTKFLFIMMIIFFTGMLLRFFLESGKYGLLKAFLTSGTSCITAAISIFLIIRGHARISAGLVVVMQMSIIFLSGMAKTPQIFLVTGVFFCYPTLLLAVIYTPAAMHISTLMASLTMVILNMIRFNQAGGASSIFNDIIFGGTITTFISLILVYVLAYVAMRSLHTALQMSNDEVDKSTEKNNRITMLVETIKQSHNDLTASINNTDQAISGIFTNIQTEAATIEELVASIEEISSSTSSIEKTIISQSNSVNSLSGRITQLSEMIDSLQIFGNELQSEFESITGMTIEGTESSESLDRMNRKTLENSANVQSIAAIIDDFFDKINLLSLNASIEAARAGDQGRGFAVVADEIGKLADNSSSELKKIKELVDTNRGDVEQASIIISNIISFINSLSVSMAGAREKVTGTMAVISQQKELQGAMLDGTNTVLENSDFIKNSSSEQSIAIQEIAKSIENTNMLIQENSASAQILMDSYDRLKTLAGNLKETMEL
ncbi:MAG TPA: methyl-accepting chemotaxis protein [Spirochaetota bacterium]|nr:methyl-accepting chemotaxis protein [Spirochaetota bacterium]